MNNQLIPDDEILRKSVSKWLEDSRREQPSADFTDRVMNQVHVVVSQQGTHAKDAPSGIVQLRRDLIHGAVAAAATYIFIQAGVLGKILSLNTTVLEVTHFIERISGYFTF
ncbi:hypothetical protein NV379_18990 [Paenibacillus sp. N1-5-1-14]|uniref:hypothetical protein n=1 Tax=Paenibacillus radicibacter TaxID=2972488 RepID=UPI0021590A2A|nr:hypothetical protein [Paenibacillus radicibacter]MCR8644745.1 hypothetical protein [Paenibacillus radicibacter]